MTKYCIFTIWLQIVANGLQSIPLARVVVTLASTEEVMSSAILLLRLTASTTTMRPIPTLTFRSVHFYIVALSPKCDKFKMWNKEKCFTFYFFPSSKIEKVV